MSKRVVVYPFVVLIGILSVGFFLGYQLDEAKRKDRENVLAVTSASLAQSLQQQLVFTLSSTSMLETALRLADYKIQGFNDWGREILASNPGLAAVQFAPKGVVSYIYPLAGNEKAIGHNLLKDPERRKAAMEAIKDRRLTLVGPLRLIQNDRMALIARKPIMVQRNGQQAFWGFSIALIDLDNFIRTALKPTELRGIAYRIDGYNPDHPKATLIARSKEEVGADARVFPITVPNGQWQLLVGYTVPYEGDAMRYLICAAAATLAMIMAFVVFHHERVNARQAKELANANRELENLAQTDVLTRLPNRRCALTFAENIISLAQRYHKPLSVAMLDLDYFKKINDEYGHVVGDAALAHFAALINGSIRTSDMVARWGGEEFLLVMPETEAAGAVILANQLRERLRQTPMEYGGMTIPFTVSIGVAEISGDLYTMKDAVLPLIDRSDQALYEAKAAGRDFVMVYS